MTPEAFIASLAVNLTSSAVWNYVEQFLSKNPQATKAELEARLASFLHVKDAKISAEKIINFMAERGDIIIEGSRVVAKSIVISSQHGFFNIENNSELETTSKSKIQTGDGSIQGGQGARIDMDENGNITFSAGSGR